MAADESSINDLTAAKLAVECQSNKGTGKTTCLSNVVEFIRQSDYDIIALQESKNWQEIYALVKDKGYLYINFMMRHPFGAMVDITLFYKPPFTVKGGYFANIVDGDARPYQFLWMNNGVQDFYFINIHNGHLISKTTLEQIIQSNTTFVPLRENVDVHFLDDKWTVDEAPVTPVMQPKNTELPLVIAGDFNDHGKYNYWKGLTVNSKELVSEKPPPTCCTPVKNKYVWLGAPSILYNPRLRNEILGIDLDFIFDITTFSSTACVGANSKENLDYDLCATTKSLKERCFSDRYRTHNALSGPLEGGFITNMGDVASKLMEEQEVGFESKLPYQRYNEILTVFFPWEIFGIEVGGHDMAVSLEFQAKVNENRAILLREYDSIDLVALNASVNDPRTISVYGETTPGEYLLIKYLKLLKCNGNYTDELGILEKIKHHLSYPVELFEYGRKSQTELFSLFKVNENRTTNFEVFTQNGSTFENGKLVVTKVLPHDNFNSTLNLSESTETTATEEKDYLEDQPLMGRCLLIDTQHQSPTFGKVQIDEFITEMFVGRIKRDWALNGWLNLVVNPATVIMKGANVIFAAQIFDRDFMKNKKIRTPTTYDEYFQSLEIGLRTREFDNDIKLGDYILASDDFEQVTTKIPALYEQFRDSNETPTSDHIPVEAIVEFKGALPAPPAPLLRANSNPLPRRPLLRRSISSPAAGGSRKNKKTRKTNKKIRKTRKQRKTKQRKTKYIDIV